MRLSLLVASMLPILWSAPTLAQSAEGLDPQTAQLAEQLGQCMVAKSSGEDRIAVAGWMLAAIASAPQLGDIAKVEPARKEAADRKMAALFTRLITADCAEQSRALFATKSTRAFEVAGGALGGIAMRELLGNPAATAALEAYATFLNEADFEGVRAK